MSIEIEHPKRVALINKPRACLEINLNLAETIDLSECLVIVIDVQHEGTSEEGYLAKFFFKGSTSADKKMVTSIWDTAALLEKKGAKVLGVRLVHDLSHMSKIDPQRLQNQINKGLIETDADGNQVPKIYKPGSHGAEIDYGESAYRLAPGSTMDKCTRDLSEEPQILQQISRPIVVLMGLDANVCVYESALGLVEKLPEKQLLILIDKVSTRPEDDDDTTAKYQELQRTGVIFVDSEDFHLR
ncbi:hypothetical protein KBC89_05540 [Candidatus Woesebacteria bacterium]|nr:hypothetical protein [Candidatus Woesebacteria bacterium]